MKKKLVLIACISLIVSGINAQSDSPVKFAFAIQPATSWIAPEGQILENESSRIGFSYGVIIDLVIAGNDNYNFSTGVLINSHGGTLNNPKYHDGTTTITDPNGGPDPILYPAFAFAKEEYRLQYLDVPLTLKLKTNEIGYMTYYGQFGLDMSFNIKARRDVEYNFPEEGVMNIEDEDVLDEIGLLRMALQVGAGVEYNISGNTSLLVGVVWNNGLTNTFNKNYLLEDANGNPEFSDNNRLREGGKVKAVSNYLGLTVGVFF